MNRRAFMQRMFGTTVFIAVPSLWVPESASVTLLKAPTRPNGLAVGDLWVRQWTTKGFVTLEAFDGKQWRTIAKEPYKIAEN